MRASRLPLQVPEAVCLPSMTYHEAWEMSYFGANVLHPRTTLPAMKYHIPITIRNFFNQQAAGAAAGRARGCVFTCQAKMAREPPTACERCTRGENAHANGMCLPHPPPRARAGTRVADLAMDQEVYKGKVTIKGIATIDRVTLINVEVGRARLGPVLPEVGLLTIRPNTICMHLPLCACIGVTPSAFLTASMQCARWMQGTGMVGVPGIASRIFASVRDAGINVIMISQASSEQSICFAVKQQDGELAANVLRDRWVAHRPGLERSDPPLLHACVHQSILGWSITSASLTSASVFM